MRRLFLLLLAAPLAACSSRGGSITLVPASGATARVQTFDQAFVTRPSAGEFDLILIDSGAQRPRKSRKGPLQPAAISPLQQVFHVHLYWLPMVGTIKNPAAINASFTWYVFGAEGTDDLIVYEGAGLVTLSGTGAVESLRIRDGDLKPTLVRGDLSDPIGAASLTGAGKVRLNPERVRDTLARLQTLRNEAMSHTSSVASGARPELNSYPPLKSVENSAPPQ